MTIAESHQTWRLTLLEEGKTTQNSNPLNGQKKKWIRGFVDNSYTIINYYLIIYPRGVNFSGSLN